jgi:hypothetical protein
MRYNSADERTLQTTAGDIEWGLRTQMRLPHKKGEEKQMTRRMKNPVMVNDCEEDWIVGISSG